MHLLPDGGAGLRIIDSDRVCDAIAALGDRRGVLDWARRYSSLADPTRLSLLLCVHRAGPISVSDLAAAVGLSEATVSQSLRLLRGGGAVSAEREGRVVRYTLADQTLVPLLEAVNPDAELHHSQGSAAGCG